MSRSDGSILPAMARVLVVDDEPEIAEAVSHYLRLLGYCVDSAASGEEALQTLARAPYDVAILDVRLPGIDGVELMRWTRGLYPDMAVILLTGHATLDSAIAAVQAHAADYLRKPVVFDDLAEAVARAVSRLPQGRHGDPKTAPVDVLRVGRVTLERDRCQVTVATPDGSYFQTARLTPTETALLSHLMRRAGSLVSYLELAEEGLQYDLGQAEARALVSPHICRLRRKLSSGPDAPRLIETIRGQGYLFAVPQG